MSKIVYVRRKGQQKFHHFLLSDNEADKLPENLENLEIEICDVESLHSSADMIISMNAEIPYETNN